jgi:hypothetical protein
VSQNEVSPWRKSTRSGGGSGDCVEVTVIEQRSA